MPGTEKNKKRKPRIKSYGRADIEAAKSLIENGWTVKRAAAAYKIPRTTLILHLKGWKNRNQTENKNVGRPVEMKEVDERHLAVCLQTMNKWGFGLSRKEVLSLVETCLIENKIKTRFVNNRPGKDWFIGFCKRWNFSCKKPTKRQSIRTEQISPDIIYGFFDLLEETIQNLSLGDKPSRIFNLDETFICHDPNTSKVVATKNKAVFRTTQGTGRANTSVLSCIAADGKKMPPVYSV